MTRTTLLLSATMMLLCCGPAELGVPFDAEYFDEDGRPSGTRSGFGTATLPTPCADQPLPTGGYDHEQRSASGLIAYLPGNLPIILSAPHGGPVTGGLPYRSAQRAAACAGSEKFITGNDAYSLQYALQLRNRIYHLTGRYPHLVINRLARSRLDANRTLCVAATGNAKATSAWHEYHAFIEQARQTVTRYCGRGHYFDLHSKVSRAVVELGYLVKAPVLDLPDDAINNGGHAGASSIRSLAAKSPLSFAQLLRGSTSLGAGLQKRGFATVPSPARAAPVEAYFSGGYNTRRHGSLDGGRIDGTQIEAHRSMIDTAAERSTFTQALAESVVEYVEHQHRFTLAAPSGERVVDNSTAGRSAGGLGLWKRSAGSSPYGSGSVYSRDVHASYTFSAAVAGDVSVAFRWTGYRSRCSAVPVEIFDGSTPLARIDVNQRRGAGSWLDLGVFHFTDNANLVVHSASSGCSTSADAVRLTSSAGTVVIDNSEPGVGTFFEGQWKRSAGANPHGPDSLYSRDPDGRYTLSADARGDVEVMLRWTPYRTRCKAVKVNVQDSDFQTDTLTTIDTLTINQQQSAESWHRLGSYRFNGQARVMVHASRDCSTSVDAVRLLVR